MLELNSSKKKAVDFLISNKSDNHLWSDFYIRNYGESVDWVSSYIGLSLLRSGIQAESLENTAEAIIQRQNSKYHGWGFNGVAPPDADSTAFAIMFLSNFDNHKKDTGKARKFLLKHQNEEGHFQTYLTEIVKPYITYDLSADGWCSGTSEVTATSLQTIKRNQKAITAMVKSQMQDGSWNSYWYNDDLYATSYAVIALEDNKKCKENVLLARKWISEKLNFDIPFYLALSLQALAEDTNYKETTRKGIEELVNMQEQDGSWKSYPILRFPMPSNLEPWKNQNRLREDVSDQKRLFTTATCLDTINRVIKKDLF